MAELAHMDEDEQKQTKEGDGEGAEGEEGQAPARSSIDKRASMEANTLLDRNITLVKRAGEADRNLTGELWGWRGRETRLWEKGRVVV